MKSRCRYNEHIFDAEFIQADSTKVQFLCFVIFWRFNVLHGSAVTFWVYIFLSWIIVLPGESAVGVTGRLLRRDLGAFCCCCFYYRFFFQPNGGQL